MATTVSTFDHTSDLLTQFDGNGESRLASPQDLGGRVRVAKFSKTLTGVATDDLIELVRLPSATIVGGGVSWSDLGTGTISIGTDDGTTADPDALASALATSAAGNSALLEAAANQAVTVASPFSIYANLEDLTTVDTAGVLTGFVLYVENS